MLPQFINRLHASSDLDVACTQVQIYTHVINAVMYSSDQLTQVLLFLCLDGFGSILAGWKTGMQHACGRSSSLIGHSAPF